MPGLPPFFLRDFGYLCSMDGIVLLSILAGMAMTLSGCGTEPAEHCVVPMITGADLQLDKVSGDCCAGFKTVGGVMKTQIDKDVDQMETGDPQEPAPPPLDEVCPAVGKLCSCRDSSNPLIKKAIKLLQKKWGDQVVDTECAHKDVYVAQCEKNGPASQEHFASLQQIFAETTYAAAKVQNAEINMHGTAAYALVAAFGGAMSGALVLYSARRFNAGQVSQPPLLGQ